MFQPVANTLDPKDFVIAPPVAAIDEFRMTNDAGNFVADVNADFLQKLVDHMNDREAQTGDLAPLVIGHTVDGVPETEGPPVVGFARSWFIAPLGNTGRLAAFFTPWIYKNEVERVKRYPRRSCEVWASRYEADPISLLGATSPARDLGLMKLSREGSFTYYSPGEMKMPFDDKDKDKDIGNGKDKESGKPAPEPKESGANADLSAKLDQILAALTQLTTGMCAGAPPGAPGAAPGAGPAVDPNAPPGAGCCEGLPGGEMSDEEFQKMLEELGQPEGRPGGEDDKSRKAEPEPVKNYGYPGNGNTQMAQHLARSDADELRDARVRLARSEVRECLRDLDCPEVLNPKDEVLVNDLIAMPPDVRQRYIANVAKLARPKTIADSTNLSAAVSNASGAPAGLNGVSGKRITTNEERDQVAKLARSKQIDFGSAARELGYVFGS